jgi:NAD(P)-dependent dehydrogenase (short-subunit alcohol dehydrogenase family)
VADLQTRPGLHPLHRLSGLQDKIAIVTGGGRMRSTGRAIAVALAEAGCDVVVTSRGRRTAEEMPADERQARWKGIESVAEEIRALGRRASPVVSDVTDPLAVDALVDHVITEFGRVDILVNNAAAARGPDRQAVVDVDPAVWHEVIDTNLHGTFYCSRAVARRMIKQGAGGCIVNISSIGGKLMMPNNAAYSVSKVGTHALTSAMSGELGPYGIRVNAICPGVLDTSRVDDIRGDEAAWSGLMAQIPLGRPGTGADVAALTVFLCSDQGSWITGQQWNVDGGQVTVH